MQWSLKQLQVCMFTNLLWNKEIKSILGETPLYAYPHGVEIEDNTKKDLLMSNGFKIFFHNSNTSKIDKYGDIVTVYKIGDISLELCGGPHVSNTSELGKFKLKKEEASSAGVRRIKAILE